MLIAYLPLFIAILGILMWVLATNPKLQRIGEWMFVIGFFWFVYALTGKTIKIL